MLPDVYEKTKQHQFYAVLGALESTLIQSFVGLSNIKFSELGIVKMKENCSAIEMRLNTVPVKELEHETPVAPALFIHTQHGNLAMI